MPLELNWLLCLPVFYIITVLKQCLSLEYATWLQDALCYSFTFPSMDYLPMNHQGNSLPKAQTTLNSTADCQQITLFAGPLEPIISSNVALVSG